MKTIESNDPKDPKKGITQQPAEEQQLEKKDKPVKPGAEEDENELDMEEDDPEFDPYDEDGGDNDFKNKAAKEKREEAEKTESLDGIEGTDTHITNKEEEIVNKKGQ